MRLGIERGTKKEYVDLQNGKRYFSISQIRKEMFDPFANANSRDLQAARERGITLHRRFALAVASRSGLCPYPDVIPQYAGYCRCMDEWTKTLECEVIHLEEPDISTEFGFGGTAENLLRMPVGLGIIDLKTGAESRTDGIQLMLNSRLDNYREATYFADLYITENGPPRLEERKFDPFGFAAAIAMLQVMKWRLTL